jgi:sec-independent protein translocase protein TatB
MLPGVGGTELVIIAIVALVVVGPKDLPMLMRKVGQFLGRMRAMANDFRASFDEMARQSELDELRKEVEALRQGQLDPLKAEMDSTADAINSSLYGSGEVFPGAYDLPTASPQPEPAPKPKRVRKAPAAAASSKPAAKKPAAKRSGGLKAKPSKVEL